jgi:hypothetical protein
MVLAAQSGLQLGASISIYLLRTATLVFTLGVSSAWFHESAHRLIGRTQTTDMKFRFMYYVVPVSVEYENPNQFTDIGLAITGVAPQLLLLPYVVAHWLLYGIPYPLSWVLDGHYVELLTSTVFFGAVAGGLVISPSDLFAVFFQNEFRHWEERGYLEMSKWEQFEVLISKLVS